MISTRFIVFPVIKTSSARRREKGYHKTLRHEKSHDNLRSWIKESTIPFANSTNDTEATKAQMAEGMVPNFLVQYNLIIRTVDHLGLLFKEFL